MSSSARAVTTWNRACERRTSNIHHLANDGPYCHDGDKRKRVQRVTVSGGSLCQRLDPSFQNSGHVRNRPYCLPATLKLKCFFWMHAWEWRESIALTLWEAVNWLCFESHPRKLMEGNLLRSMTRGNPLLRQQKIDVDNVPRSALKSIMRTPSVTCKKNKRSHQIDDQRQKA